jgi:hypothetical protein
MTSSPRLTFPPPKPSPPPAPTPAIIAGVLAALAGAAIWTGFVVFTDTEFGWIAWGIGALVGFVMSRVTPLRSPQLAVTAAVLAAVGLGIGKVATVRALVPTLGTEMIASNPEALAAVYAMDMRENERFSPEISVQLASLSTTDTLPDALWVTMLDEARTRLANASPEERERIALTFANRMLVQVGLVEQFKSSLSLFDLLWFGLAIATAAKFMMG